MAEDNDREQDPEGHELFSLKGNNSRVDNSINKKVQQMSNIKSRVKEKRMGSKTDCIRTILGHYYRCILFLRGMKFK